MTVSSDESTTSVTRVSPDSADSEYGALTSVDTWGTSALTGNGRRNGSAVETRDWILAHGYGEDR